MMPVTRSPSSEREPGAAGSPPALHEAEIESRWEAAPAVVLVIGLQLLLAMVSERGGWKLWGLPWWVWLVSIVPESLLLVALAFRSPRRQLEQIGHRRTAAVGLFGIVSLSNALALGALLGSLVSGEEKSGPELLLKGLTIWGTNVIVFGLWFWGFDRGGPIRRRAPDAPAPDFQFPQLENPQLAEPGWHPRLLDYVYISFTNSIAFSPTDAMPLTRWAKALMLTESAVSAVTVLLVAARSVNIFK
jgi:hypothetical protein